MATTEGCSPAGRGVSGTDEVLGGIEDRGRVRTRRKVTNEQMRRCKRVTNARVSESLYSVEKASSECEAMDGNRTDRGSKEDDEDDDDAEVLRLLTRAFLPFDRADDGRSEVKIRSENVRETGVDTSDVWSPRGSTGRTRTYF